LYLHLLPALQDVISPPKTPQSRRVVDLLPSLVVLLRRYREDVDAMGLLVGRLVTPDDFVFAHPDGRPLEPNTLTHTFLRVMRAAGIDLNLHGLRHTFASMMLAAGVNIKVISQMLGHSSVNITLDVYSHLMPAAAIRP
jgi:integrase